MEYVLHILILVCLYAILAVSLDLVVGQTGLLSVAHAAFYGIGAYTTALLAVHADSPFLFNLLASVCVAAAIAMVVVLPSGRLSGEFFLVATFAFQVIAFSSLKNLRAITEGPMGIKGIPAPVIFGVSVESRFQFLVLVGLLVGLACIVVWTVAKSPYGRVLNAVRDDEVFAKALGKNAYRAKISVFALSAAIASMSGSVYAHYISFIEPTGFSVMESILIISMVIIGGTGTLRGPLVGAVVLVSFPELLRFIGLPSSVAAHLRQVIYGSLLVLMMVLRPRGLMGRYAFGQ